MTKYDSTKDTKAHIDRINVLGKDFVGQMVKQLIKHDVPELEGAEKKAFIERINDLGADFITKFTRQLKKHDASKLEGIEKKTFDEISPLLKKFEYGSQEYMDSLKKMEEGIKSHYKNNSHHPEHHEKGISGMNLFDLVEMVLDWKAACERTKDGDIRKSLEIQAKRFNLTKEMRAIIENTIDKMGW